MSAWRPVLTGRFGEDRVGQHPRVLHRVYTGELSFFSLSALILLLFVNAIVWKGLVKSMLQLPKSANSIDWSHVFIGEYQNIALYLQESETLSVCSSGTF